MSVLPSPIPSPGVMKILMLNSTEYGIQLLIKTKMLKNKDSFVFKLSDVLFIMQINVKMPTIVGVLTFMSMINYMFS